MLNILLIDDHALFRQGLQFILSDLEADLNFAEADSCQQALAIDRQQDIDLILLDHHMPGAYSGIEALRIIKENFEGATVVVISGEENPHIIRSAIEEGAGGFIPKASTPNVLIAALKLILAGGIYLPPTSLSLQQSEPEAQNHSPRDISATISSLSDRQQQTLIAALKGKPNKIIARELDIAEGTVKAHLSIAFKALGAKNRTEAVYMAAKEGFKP